MNKKILIPVLTAVLVCPAFAEITNNATCNTTNLGQSNNNSTANVEANWNANTININWYNGDTRVAQNTCTYDGSITLPTEPTKPGYTFAGWRLRNAPAVPNCRAISDKQTCDNTDGCKYFMGTCNVVVEDCSVITNFEDCGNSMESGFSYSLCGWSDTTQTCFSNGLGGTND